jgi:hypothetical protein
VSSYINPQVDIANISSRKDEFFTNYILENVTGINILLKNDLNLRIRQLSLYDWYVDIKDAVNVYALKFLKQHEIMDFVNDNLKSYDQILEIQLKCNDNEHYKPIWSSNSINKQKLNIRENLQKINDELSFMSKKN